MGSTVRGPGMDAALLCKQIGNRITARDSLPNHAATQAAAPCTRPVAIMNGVAASRPCWEGWSSEARAEDGKQSPGTQRNAHLLPLPLQVHCFFPAGQAPKKLEDRDCGAGTRARIGTQNQDLTSLPYRSNYTKLESRHTATDHKHIYASPVSPPLQYTNITR
eukprot:1161671-Pelagomonas_calceolata.AAC.20